MEPDPCPEQEQLALRRTALVSLGVGLAILGDSALYAALPTQVAAMGLTPMLAGLMLSANRVVRLVTNPLAARISGKHGIARPFTWALVAAVLTTLAWAFPLPALLLLLARAVWGFSWSMLRLAGHLVALSGSSAQRGRRMGVFRGIFRGGSLVAALGAGVLTDLMGFQAAMAVMAGAIAIGMPFYLRLNPLAGIAPAGVPLEVHGRNLAGKATPRQWFEDARFNVGGFLHSLLLSLFATTMGYHLSQSLGDTEMTLGVATLSGILFAWLWLGNIVLGPACGLLADSLGRRRTVLLLVILECVSLWLVGLATRPMALVLAIAAGLAFGAGLEVVLDTLAGDRAAAKAQRSHAMSRYATWIDAGAALGPTVGYSIGSMTGLPMLYAACSMLVLIWAITAYRTLAEGLAGPPAAARVPPRGAPL